ncbi:pilus biosynthesis protein PilO [Agarivorans sp. OAG1]|jgi:type IV pilus assembly protein PilO|uniref:Type IV pilus biogenesis protein PilO n=1 Tax=Agarivorans albus MKT 106 TaxID=1331007 RepID=R9PRU1_AGAAL|nr:type 4a pilus biogenesis protein PilO [Agarivorans albus]BEU04834.1 pilus biosynthesis protein PilO [Agarivorans sp. OAG1]GAD04020.1 type IV pilus biogenesis protein PilO [Agarivorans albus MKT 106]
MDLQELNELDLESIGTWPKLAKIVFVVVVCGLITAGYYYYQIADEKTKLVQLEAKEQELRQKFEVKAALAGNLPEYQKQVEEMKKAFASLLKQLPEKHEIPGLLDELSFIGIDNGLEFRRINWEPEVEHEFSTELPIKLEVSGSYHQLGAFVSAVAALPRIVILDNITMKKQGDGGTLSMAMLAKTYRYKEKPAAKGK